MYPRSFGRALSALAGLAVATDALAEPALERQAFLQAVLEANAGLAATRGALDAARADEGDAGAWQDPMVEEDLAPLSLASGGAALGYGLTLSQALPSGGRQSASRALARAATRGAEAELATARQELALLALDGWSAWFLAWRALDVNAAHATLLDELALTARGALMAGRASVPLALEQERARLDLDRLALEAERASVQARLNALLHQPAQAPVPPPPDDVDAPAPSEKPAARPEVAAMDAGLARAYAAVDLARAERRPMLGLMASWSTMWMDPEHRLMVGFESTVPLPSRADRAAVAAAQAEQHRAELARTALLDQVDAEVATAAARLVQAQGTVAILEERLLPLARQRWEVARAGFLAGQEDVGAVIEAERALRDAELDLHRARAARLDAQTALDRATGRL